MDWVRRRAGWLLGPLRTVDDVDLRKRRRSHLAFGALDAAVAFTVLFWAVPPAGVAYAAIAAMQWSRATNHATQARCSG